MAESQYKRLMRTEYPKENPIVYLNYATLSYELSQLGIDGKERIRRSAGQYLARGTYQYTLDLQLVATYNSTAEAERATGISNIRRSCAIPMVNGFRSAPAKPTCAAT